jgi:hypothetical protein
MVLVHQLPYQKHYRAHLAVCGGHWIPKCAVTLEFSGEFIGFRA